MAFLFPLGTITSAQDEEETALRIGLMQGIDRLSPFLGLNESAHMFYGLVYDNLISYDEDLNPKPNLATSWNIVSEIEPYGSVWQYNLTHNAQWHDGEQFDAYDVKFTFDNQTGDNWPQMWAYQPYTVLIDHTDIVDEYTVRVFFSDYEGDPAPCSFGYSLMMPIVPEHIWSVIPVSEAAFSYENRHPIGTGPFMCTDSTWDEWIEGDALTLYRNPDYHGAMEYGDEVSFEMLVLKFYQDSATMVTDMQAGAIDIAMFDTPGYEDLIYWIEDEEVDCIETYANLRCDGFSAEIGICAHPSSGAGTNLLRLDPAVRQAMAHATDKEFIRDHIYNGYGDIGSTLLSPVFDYWFWEPTSELEYNYSLDIANEILDDAGYLWNLEHTQRYAPADHPYNPYAADVWLTFGLIVDEGKHEDRLQADYLVEEWSEIGILLEPTYVDTALWGMIVYSGNYDLTFTHWSGDPDPNLLLFVQSSWALAGWSENWYSNEKYDENYTMSVTTVDPEERLLYVDTCQMRAYVDAYYIVTVYPYEFYAWRTDTFTGWGDWEAHPGRALSNYWSANDLYFDLEPIINLPPSTTSEVDGTLGENGWYRSNVTVALEATDDSGSVNRTMYCIDGADWLTYTEPIEVSGDGEHVLKYYSVDDTNLSEAEITLNLAIDTGNPSVMMDLDDGAEFNTSDVNISWESSDECSGIDVTEYMIDGEAYTPCGDCYVVLTDLEEGEHNLSVRVHDEAGNNATDTLRFVVDIPEEDTPDPDDGGVSTLTIAAVVAALAIVGVVAFMYWNGRRKRGPLPPE